MFRDQPKPLSIDAVSQVPLARSPLVRVIAQVRYPTVLAIHNRSQMSKFHELVRDTYPFLHMDSSQNVILKEFQSPTIVSEQIWRLLDDQPEYFWRVSVGENFVAIETSAYESRSHFLERLRMAMDSIDETFRPGMANRLGLRYVDQIQGKGLKKYLTWFARMFSDCPRHPRRLTILWATL